MKLSLGSFPALYAETGGCGSAEIAAVCFGQQRTWERHSEGASVERPRHPISVSSNLDEGDDYKHFPVLVKGSHVFWRIHYLLFKLILVSPLDPEALLEFAHQGG